MSQDREKKPLTKIQAAVLKEISAHIAKVGFPPTVRELTDCFGYRSQNSVNQNLKALEKKGWITRHRMMARSICVMEGEPEIIDG